MWSRSTPRWKPWRKAACRLRLAVYNAGNNRPEAFLDVTPEIYEEMWRVICFGAFVVSQATVRLMLTQQDIAERQSLFFTGASGSLRGKANFSAFASGKGALRMLAQSIAREFGPQNIHVAHVVIDGAINGEKISSRFPEFLERLGEDGTLNIGAIAEAFTKFSMLCSRIQSALMASTRLLGHKNLTCVHSRKTTKSTVACTLVWPSKKTAVGE